MAGRASTTAFLLAFWSGGRFPRSTRSKVAGSPLTTRLDGLSWPAEAIPQHGRAEEIQEARLDLRALMEILAASSSPKDLQGAIGRGKGTRISARFLARRKNSTKNSR